MLEKKMQELIIQLMELLELATESTSLPVLAPNKLDLLVLRFYRWLGHRRRSTLKDK